MLDEIFSIENKIIVITGGGSGIGQKLSFELAKCGSIVYSIDKQFKKIATAF